MNCLRTVSTRKRLWIDRMCPENNRQLSRHVSTAAVGQKLVVSSRRGADSVVLEPTNLDRCVMLLGSLEHASGN